MTMQQIKAKHQCAEVPEFERLNYFPGQMLSGSDLRSEQNYFREKLKLHNRCLHGFGVVCGLEVTTLPEEECCPPADKKEIDRARKALAKVEAELKSIHERLADPNLTEEERAELQRALETANARREEIRRKLDHRHPDRLDGGEPCTEDEKPRVPVLVHCGFALDCLGNELVLRQAVLVDLWYALKLSERERLRERGYGTLYLSICYCGEPTYRSRPVLPDTCGAVSDCNYGKTRDSLRFRVSTDRPRPDSRCEPCCAPCIDECVLLAAIHWRVDYPIGDADIDLSVRRAISPYEPTVITGISWEHGRTYSPGEAMKILGTEGDVARTDGLEVRFSRPVHAETVQPGVIDIWRIQGGKGVRGPISSVEGDYVDKPDSGLVGSIRYRDESGETLQRGDRILIIIRGDFILDECCRPVDGNHVGGRVPQIEDDEPTQAYAQQQLQEAQAAQQGKGKATDALSRGKGDQGEPSGEPCDDEPDETGPCRLPPGGIGPWTSGNGSVGGTFESWFYID